MCLTTSHVYLYKKLDEFGKDHTAAIREAVDSQGKYMHDVQKEANQAADTESILPSTVATPSVSTRIPDAGRKLTFDNIDYRQQVHFMTEENQNIDKHCVTVMSTENRVTGNHLSDKVPTDGILEMENGKCIPDHQDSVIQRENYIALVGRIISTHLPCLEFLSSVATHHIPHQYKREMSRKTDTVSIKYLDIHLFSKKVVLF